MIQFSIDEDDMEMIDEFHKGCRTPGEPEYIYTGAIGGGDKYIFQPTGLGTIVQFQCRCGAVLDLSHFEDW